LNKYLNPSEMKNLVAIICIFACFGLQAQTPSEYSIANQFQLPGDGGWDYLTFQGDNGRLFVSHSTMVQVLDAKSGKLVATIPGLNGVHGIAIAPVFNKGFITNGKDSSVTVFDLASYEKIETIKVTGANPDAVLFDAFSGNLFVYNGRSSDATVIDAKACKVVATIPLAGKPEFSVCDGKGNVYVNIEDKSEICRINSTTLKVEQCWPIAPGVEPSGLALDNETHRLFSVCDNMMIVLDALSGNVVANLPIGDRVDGVAFDPVLKRAYSSNGDGTMTIVQEVDANHFKVLGNFSTRVGARTITLDPVSHHIYLPTAEFGDTPPKTAENPRPRPALKPGSFVILDVMYTK
jgi:YVTN family beta-propeller protein